MRRTVKAVMLCSCAALWGGRAWAADATTGASISEIVVTAPRQEVQARVEQREAPNLVTVQSAETIAKYPDFNAAESLGRLPGVSLSSDTGEGRFINIRGIDGNLDGATFGGVEVRVFGDGFGRLHRHQIGRLALFDAGLDLLARGSDHDFRDAGRPRGVSGPGAAAQKGGAGAKHNGLHGRTHRVPQSFGRGTVRVWLGVA